MLITLGIDDEEAVYMVRELESSFDIVISAPEADACRTLGDLYELILQRFEGRDSGQFCGSAMAFYRLRRASVHQSPGVKLRPSTLLPDLTDGSAKRFFKDIEAATGLRLARRAPSWIGTLAAVGLLGGLLGVMAVGTSSAIGLHFWKWAWAPAAMIAFAPILWSLDPGEFPENCETLGDLARRVSRLNFGRFANAGARVNRTELWDALTEVASRYSSLPIGQMCPKPCCSKASVGRPDRAFRAASSRRGSVGFRPHWDGHGVLPYVGRTCMTPEGDRSTTINSSSGTSGNAKGCSRRVSAGSKAGALKSNSWLRDTS